MTATSPTDATGHCPSQTSKTVAWYRLRGEKYLAQARIELDNPSATLVAVIDHHFLIADERYAAATQRVMRAWLRQLVRDALERNPADGEAQAALRLLEEGPAIAALRRLRRSLRQRGDVKIRDLIDAFQVADGQYTKRLQQRIVTALRNLLAVAVTEGVLPSEEAQQLLVRLERNGPRPKIIRRKKQTSAKKRKKAPFDELQRVVKFLSVHGPLGIAAANFLKLNIFLGLRPGEWRTAYLSGSELHWVAEKTTNGRGNSKNPYVYLNNLERWGGTLRAFLNFLQPYRADDEEWLRMVDLLRSRIADACKKLGIARVSLYSSRDIYIASELALGAEPEEVAAKVNHRTTRTQRRNYAPKRFGHKRSSSLVSAPPALVATVQTTQPFLLDKVRGPQPELSP
jgi:hypothetical protein